MRPIIDIHTHAQGIMNSGKSDSSLRILRALVGHRGPIWFWEKTGYKPDVASSDERGLVSVLTALEIQLRQTLASPNRLLAAMVRAGVGRAVVLPIEPFSRSEQTLKMAAANPGLIAFACVDPRTPDAADRLDRLLSAGARGVKFHPPIQEVPAEDKAWRPLAEVAQSHGAPILCHCGYARFRVRHREADKYATPPRFLPLVEAFPKQTFILAHMGMRERNEAIELARNHENVCLETSFQHRSQIKIALEKIGADRLLFGSDWPNSDIIAPLAQVDAAAPDDATREKILWLNAERVLGPA